MRRAALVAVGAVVVAMMVGQLPTGAAGRARTFEVTITNLTSGQPLTPPAVATHRRGLRIFEVGQPAFFGVKEIAENGNLDPLLFDLGRHPRVFDSLGTTTGPLVPDGTPGAEMFDDSVTFTIRADYAARFLSWVSMLVCTNDGFTGSDRVLLPRRLGATRVAMTNGYDAGTEINTEDFADIVPPCQALIGVTSGEPGTGMSNPALAEDEVIRHHPGIMGGADLVPNVHGWDDPVARIQVTRVA